MERDRERREKSETEGGRVKEREKITEGKRERE